MTNTRGALKTSKAKVVPWMAKQSFMVSILAYISCQLFTALPLFIVLPLTGRSVDDGLLDQPWVSITLTAFGAIGMLLVLILFMKRKKWSLKKWFKLSKRPSLKTIYLVVGVYFVYIICLLIAVALAQAVIPGFNADEAQVIGYKDASGWQLLLAFLGLVVIPPIIEEMLFRGFLYQGLRDHWRRHDTLIWGLPIALITALYSPVAGVVVAGLILISVYIGQRHPARAAALVTSTLFALSHMQWNVAIDTFLLSLALIFVFEKTQNLYAAIALHTLKNLTAFIALFLLAS